MQREETRLEDEAQREKTTEMRVYRDLRHENSARIDGVGGKVQRVEDVENLARNAVSRGTDLRGKIERVQLRVKRERKGETF